MGISHPIMSDKLRPAIDRRDVSFHSIVGDGVLDVLNLVLDGVLLCMPCWTSAMSRFISP